MKLSAYDVDSDTEFTTNEPNISLLQLLWFVDGSVSKRLASEGSCIFKHEIAISLPQHCFFKLDRSEIGDFHPSGNVTR